jgi:hypothetical protein
VQQQRYDVTKTRLAIDTKALFEAEISLQLVAERLAGAQLIKIRD